VRNLARDWGEGEAFRSARQKPTRSRSPDKGSLGLQGGKTLVWESGLVHRKKVDSVSWSVGVVLGGEKKRTPLGGGGGTSDKGV